MGLTVLFTHLKIILLPQNLTFSTFSAQILLFTDPQISLFSNFFIKNGSHGTIYTFKNYFVITFFSFQFSAVFKQTLKFGVSMFVALIIRFEVFFIVHNWYSDWIFKIFRLSEMIFCIVLIMTRIYHFS